MYHTAPLNPSSFTWYKNPVQDLHQSRFTKNLTSWDKSIVMFLCIVYIVYNKMHTYLMTWCCLLRLLDAFFVPGDCASSILCLLPHCRRSSENQIKPQLDIFGQLSPQTNCKIPFAGIKKYCFFIHLQK